MLGRILRLFYSIKYKFLDRKIHISNTAFVHNAATFIVQGDERVGIYIGNDVYIGRYSNIHTSSRIKIGENSVLSDYVYLSTMSHGIDPSLGPIMKQKSYDKGPIVLGANVFLGFGVKILPNVTLGDWCIVGAGWVVTKSFPEYSMIAGNPAKLIKKFDLKKNRWINVGEFN